MTFSALVKASLNLAEVGAAAFGKNPYWNGDISFEQVFGDGITAGNFNLGYMAERTVASASNDDIDLAGVLASALGTSFAGAELVLIALLNKPRLSTDALNTTNLTIGAGTNPFVGFLGGTTPTLGPIRPGGLFLLGGPDAAGIGTITAGTGDILRVANSSGASCKYQIALLARTA
jgi:hypothetical protein